jgi:putative esterase
MSARWLTPVAIAVLGAFLAVGFVGVDHYGRKYWLDRGFPPPHDPAFVTQKGSVEHVNVTSKALGGRSQEVYVYLPPGYASHPIKRYPVLYLLHGFPGRPLAFLLTVRMGVVEDALVAKHQAQPLINRKFFPEWQRRFVVHEKRLDLPRVGIAALAAEAYLPFTGKDRR